MVLTVSVTYTATKVAVMERMEKLHIERTLTTDLSLFGLPAPTPHTICFLREHNRVNFTWQATTTVLDSVLRVFSWDTAFHLKADPEIELLKENCAIAHIALEQKTESVASSGASPRAYSQPGETTSIVAQLTHEYWNTRRDIANAAARGGRVEQRLTELGGHMNSQGAMTELELAEQVRELDQHIEEERVKLGIAEKILEDVLRECEKPVVVPELMRLAPMYGEERVKSKST